MSSALEIFLNGSFVPEAEAKVSVFDRCFLYGDGVFEGIAVWDRAPFRFDAHMARLKHGLAYLRIENPYTDDEWAQIVEDAIARNRMADGYLRIQISRGEGISSIKWEPRLLKKPQPNVTILPIPGFRDYYKGLLAEKIEAGLRGIMLSRPRMASAAVPSGIKHCNYLNSVLGAIEVTSAQADVGIAIDQQGFVTEGIAYNVFAVKGRRLSTAPLNRDILPGITRDVVIEVARAQGFEVVEELFDSFTLSAADEVFICSTLELAVPVVEISGRKIGDGKPGPVSKQLGHLLLETMEREAQDWRTRRAARVAAQ